MPLTISEDHRHQLSLLITQETQVVKEFCRLATQFLKQGVNPRIFGSAANKLGVQPLQVEDAIRALVFLLSHCTQAAASKMEFQDITTSLGFTKDAVKVLTDAYTDNETDIKEYLKTMGVQTPHYRNLEWRFDILVGSRTLTHIAEPLVTLQLSLDENTARSFQAGESGTGIEERSECVKLLLQTDPNNLVHMTNVLEEALHEARTHHSRRIHRHLK
ncbi:COMM domain-containing protein 2-like [Homarus americanus]|uniref:COMM domain-containing protein 2-like n=1 Tax=Homarus americanus TaxID=6706 RepID=A0A8J5JE66_HOMAM|nr:COMM domain-containing protein 2-like [Homarus americanus]KAG7155911.1 COMM domain-containing protein 2-like [Homarus americanus]